MYRGINKPKGIVIDIDSFKTVDYDELQELNGIIKCVFITSNLAMESDLTQKINGCKVAYIEEYERFLFPSIKNHAFHIDILGLKSADIAYLSCDYNMLKHADAFLTGSIWITQEVSYKQASAMPDLVCKNIGELLYVLKYESCGFLGEAEITQSIQDWDSVIPMIQVDYTIDSIQTPLYALGRYFASSTYMAHLHPYSTCISFNKREGKPYFGVFDSDITDILITAIRRIAPKHNAKCICAVPARIKKKNRFAKILSDVCAELGLADISTNFTCIKDYPNQKNLLAEERIENIKGVFHYTGDLSNDVVILIDDIMSTGATITECVRELRHCGAKEVVVVTLAINQFRTSAYWNTNSPKLICENCGNEMQLMMSKNKKLFFSCIHCWNFTMSLDDGWKKIRDIEDVKISMMAHEILEREVDTL